jgi:endonuclease-3 related protein
LLETYGPQHWWPGDTPLEVIVGAVLTQNTAWHNVSIAIGNLKSAELLNLDALLCAPADQVQEALRPSGFYRVKTVRLLNLLHALREHGGLEGLQSVPTREMRAILLAVNGIGPETADGILLYAFGRPTFVIDSYTRRLMMRLGHVWATTAPYDDLQRWFADALGADPSLYNEYHALIVQHGKTRCRVKPVCTDCPLLHACVRGVGTTDSITTRVQPPARDGV